MRARAAFASGVVSAVTDDDGSLWVWGRSKRGQLGLGTDVIEATTPSKVEELSGHEIVKVLFMSYYVEKVEGMNCKEELLTKYHGHLYRFITIILAIQSVKLEVKMFFLAEISEHL